MNATAPTRILIIDDNPSIHEDFRKILQNDSSQDTQLFSIEEELFGEVKRGPTRGGFGVDSAFQGPEGLQKVKDALASGSPYPMAFVDVRMPPGWDGVETVTHLWQVQPDLQIVICTAYSDFSWEEMAARLGKSDRLLIIKKPFDTVEVLQLAHTLVEKWSLTQRVNAQMSQLDSLVSERTRELMDTNRRLTLEIEDRAQAQEAHAESEERFLKAFISNPMPQAIVSASPPAYISVNQGFLAMTGFDEAEISKTPLFSQPVWEAPETRVRIESLLHEGTGIRNWQCKVFTKSRQARTASLSVEPLTLHDQRHLLLMVEDITDRLSLEAQLRQAQKMEAIGQLAAGVAHDFNNLLTVIQGHGELVLANKALNDRARTGLEQIMQAGRRASQLTSQLLTFSRKQVVQFRAVDMNRVLGNLTKMLTRLLGETITVQMSPAKDLPLINADVGMLEQVLVNLAVNARDAMPTGGKLVVQTRSMELDASFTSASGDQVPGRFVCVEVTDNGTGMDASTLERIFEPFFTTKPVGQGTGLGLATVYAIVKQHGGWVDVASQLGTGTTFKLFYPALKKTASSLEPELEAAAAVRGGCESILLVEDEPAVRGLVAHVLQDYGYKVWQAGDGREALDMWQQCREHIDLLLTDMVMPEGVTGKELADHLKQDKPDLKVLYTSGYSPELISDGLELKEHVNFLPKPYHPKTLARTVRDCLAEGHADDTVPPSAQDLKDPASPNT